MCIAWIKVTKDNTEWGHVLAQTDWDSYILYTWWQGLVPWISVCALSGNNTSKENSTPHPSLKWRSQKMHMLFKINPLPWNKSERDISQSSCSKSPLLSYQQPTMTCPPQVSPPIAGQAHHSVSGLVNTQLSWQCVHLIKFVLKFNFQYFFIVDIVVCVDPLNKDLYTTKMSKTRKNG
jgi:hypothetical protein